MDNLPSKEDGRTFVESKRLEAILTPPFGDVFDPEQLVEMYRRGASEEELARIEKQ